MWRLYFLLATILASAEASQRNERIVGGSVVDITQYPFAAVMLRPHMGAFRQYCGGTIINNRSIMTATHCIRGISGTFNYRVGSTNANSGGAIHNVANFFSHPSYDIGGFRNNDITIVRVTSAFVFGANVGVVRIPGRAFVVPDNTNVTSIGWGATSIGAPLSDQLRHVQLTIVNQAECARMYGPDITPNKICAGWPTDGRGICTADSGSPLVHNNVAIGIASFSRGCGVAIWPSVYARVSSFHDWILANA